MSLPNLANLTLHAAPMAALFEEFEDARGNISAAAEKRSDWDPSTWKGADAPDCPICFEPLNRKSTNGAQTKEVEVLLENPACSHAFHRECIEMWIQTVLEDNDKALRCPTCSRPIDQVVLDTVFDASANIQEVAEDDGFDEMVQQQQENAAQVLQMEQQQQQQQQQQQAPTEEQQLMNFYRDHTEYIADEIILEDYHRTVDTLVEWTWRYGGVPNMTSPEQIHEVLKAAWYFCVDKFIDANPVNFPLSKLQLLELLLQQESMGPVNSWYRGNPYNFTETRLYATLIYFYDSVWHRIENNQLREIMGTQLVPVAPTDLSLFGSTPPMFQGQRVYSLEYAEIERTRGYREGWIVTAVLNLGDERLRGRSTETTFVLEVYRVTDYEPNDLDLILYEGGQFVAKVVRSMRPFEMNDFNRAAWRHLNAKIAPIAMADGLDASMHQQFYNAILVALGMPARRIARTLYDSYRARESERDALPADWL